MPKIPAALKKEVAGVPVGVWLILLAGGLYVAYRMRQANAEVPSEEDMFADEFDEYGYDDDYGFYPFPGEGGGFIDFPLPPAQTKPQKVIISMKCPPGTHWNKARRRCVPNKRKRRRRRPPKNPRGRRRKRPKSRR
jgi:hypothetical protein